MKLFTELKLMEVLDDATIYMAEVNNMIGSESWSAERVRRFRDKQKALLCNGDVTSCNEEKEIEIKKDIDTDIEIERENEKAFAHSIENDSLSDLSTEFSTSEEKKRKFLGGELGKGVVLLSDEQMADLLDKLSVEEFDYYVGVVADCILSGKKYTRKTHYQAIMDMALADRKVK
jgi:hypothetical protein